MLAVAYFAALLARSADRWTARDADLDEIEDVAGLVEFMREVPPDTDEEDEPDTTVLFLEQEDVWFAVVRLDAEEDPRLFVSDVAAVSRSGYADLLLSGDLAPIGPDGRPATTPAAAIPAPATSVGAGAGAAADTLSIDEIDPDADPSIAADIDPDIDIDADIDATTDDVDLDEAEAVGIAQRPALADLTDTELDERRPLHSGPAGDANLLADFGVRASKLIGLCAASVLPADALADLAEALGAADELEEVR